MELFTLPPQKVVMVLLILLLTAAVFDVLYRRIPNWLTVSGVVLGLAMNTVIGTPEGVKARLQELKEQFQADEVMVITITGDYASRLRSYELLAEACGVGAN